MITHSPVVAVTPLFAVQAIGARRTGVGADLPGPAFGTIALPVHRVTRASVLTLARGLAFCTMGPWRAGLLTPMEQMKNEL